jgi:S1-C subfamily serine protease
MFDMFEEKNGQTGSASGAGAGGSQAAPEAPRSFTAPPAPAGGGASAPVCDAAAPDAPLSDVPEEPREVVSWYIPSASRPAGEEAVSWYIPPREEPRRTTEEWHQAARKEKKRRRGVWLFVACLAVILGVVLIAGIGGGLLHKPTPDALPSDGDDASSIIDIFQDRKKTTIPRVEGDPSVRLVCVPNDTDELTPREIYARVNPSVVTVVATDRESASVGTGVILSADGYIVTNAHVITGGDSCWIALDTGVTYDAKLVGFDELADVAVLKVDAADLPPAEFGDSDLCAVGDPAYAIGNPLGVELRGTFTDGILSAVDRQVDVDGQTMTLIQTNAALNNGNSGGPLINAAGQVIGINTIKMGSSEEAEASVEGLGFALPISTTSFVVNDLIATGEFHGMPMLGVMVTTQATEDGGTRLVIYSVSEDSGAEAAGLQKDDVITAADGEPVADTRGLLAQRRNHAVGDTMTLTILRDGVPMEVEVVLGSDRD